jgi:hypothetical protein
MGINFLRGWRAVWYVYRYKDECECDDRNRVKTQKPMRCAPSKNARRDWER